MSSIQVNPEIVFAALLKRDGLPEPEREYRFHKDRKWRFDYAFPRWKVALEVEGGVFGFTDPKTGKRRMGGAHSSITGIKRDIEKYSYAAAMGWLVVRCMPTTLATGETLAFVKGALKSHGWTPNEQTTVK